MLISIEVQAQYLEGVINDSVTAIDCERGLIITPTVRATIAPIRYASLHVYELIASVR